ncbi:unnamed protein product [Brassica oleracea]
MDDFSVQREYWRQVSESEGFDIEDVSIPYGTITGLMPYDCLRFKTYPYSVLVNLYAQMALHQSRILRTEQLELVSLLKFNMLQNLVSSFYMTLLVRDRSTSEEGEFQVRIDERIYGSLYIACTVARFKDEVRFKRPFVPHFHDGKEIPELPDWPSDALVREFILDASSCRYSGFDWTYLYLKLVVCAHDRWISEEALSKLEIMYAVLIPMHGPTKGVNIFIVYKGLAKGEGVAEIGEDVERKAVVSQVFNDNGYLSLRGKLL